LESVAKKRKRRPRAVATESRPRPAERQAEGPHRKDAPGRRGRDDGSRGPKAAERPSSGGAAAERHDRKEEARHQREQIRKRMARRRRTRQGGIALAVVVIVGVAAYLITSSNGTSTPNVKPDALAGLNTGPPPWPAELTHLHDRLLAIGLQPLAAEGTGLHSDQHLDIYVDGKPVQIPEHIGIPPGYTGQTGGTNTDFISILHTHDTSGTVHVEAPSSVSYTLGEFFDVWGVRFTPTCLGSLCETKDKQIRLYENGKLQTGDPTKFGFSLQPFSQEIVLTYGTKAELPNPIPSQIPGA
jgi:hypothetical protein